MKYTEEWVGGSWKKTSAKCQRLRQGKTTAEPEKQALVGHGMGEVTSDAVDLAPSRLTSDPVVEANAPKSGQITGWG